MVILMLNNKPFNILELVGSYSVMVTAYDFESGHPRLNPEGGCDCIEGRSISVSVVRRTFTFTKKYLHLAGPFERHISCKTKISVGGNCKKFLYSFMVSGTISLICCGLFEQVQWHLDGLFNTALCRTRPFLKWDLRLLTVRCLTPPASSICS